MAGKNNKNNKPVNAEENAVFGNTPAPTPANTDKPITNDAPENTEEMVSIPASVFQDVLSRLNTLETKEASVARESDSEIFDPLKPLSGDPICRVSYMFIPETGENHLVVGYKSRKRADGTEQYTWLQKEEKTGELRTYCSLYLMDENGKVYEKDGIDYLMFLEGLSTRDVPIKKRTDVGQLVKQEFTTQRIWNGRTLAPTPTKVQTGYKEQKFEYDVEIDGKIIHLKQNVINIR